MKKRLLQWMTTFVVVISMVLGGSVTASAASVTGTLDWSWNVPVTDDGYGFGYGISSPVTKGSFVYVVSYDKLYMIHATSGVVTDVTGLGGNIMYSRIEPTIAGNKIVVPLADSKLAIVSYDGKTTVELEKVITYKEGENGYQSNTQAVYDSEENAVYLGSWGKGGKDGTYVQVDLDADENGDYKVTEITNGRGFYCAGAAIDGDYVVFGADATDSDDDDSSNVTGTGKLYAWKKGTEKPISVELPDSGGIRSAIVAHDNAYYFMARGGGLYKAVIDNTDPENPTISAELITDLGAGSICTPIIVEETVDGTAITYAYAGYQTASATGEVAKVDLTATTPSETALVVADDIPAIVADLYQVTSSMTVEEGKGNIYATYNGMPGGIWDVTNDTVYYEPDSDMRQFCLSSIVQNSKRMYYTNDSGSLMAITPSSVAAGKHKLTVTAGEEGRVSPANLLISSGYDATITITPDEGYKISSIKVDGVSQELGHTDLWNTNINETKFIVQDVAKDTSVEILFSPVGKPVTEKIETSIQTGDVYNMAHEELNVRSDLAEEYGYEDNVIGDKVSVTDVLVAAHIARYGEDKATINEKLIMADGGPTTMLGKDKTSIESTSNAMTGFVVNGNTALEAPKTGSTPDTADVKSGDRVDFFWYVTAEGYDIWTSFLDENGEQMFSKTVHEGEPFDVAVKGFVLQEAMGTKGKYALEFKKSYTYEYSIAETPLFLLEKKVEDGAVTYVQKETLKGENGEALTTDAASGTATLKLDPGKYYISAEKEGESVYDMGYGEAYIVRTHFRTLMPWLEVTVLCDEHSFKDDKCEVCEFEKTNIGKGTAILSFDKADYTGKAIEPTVKVTVAGKELKLKDDYTIEYSNNIEPGTATVTIKGAGYYTGTITKTFRIVKPADPAPAPIPTPEPDPVVGDESEDKYGDYEVTETKGGKVEVAYTAPASKNKTTVTIPATTKLPDGTVAKVTSIDAKAFKNNKKIKKVTIGKNVETIGKEAFSGATKLTTVTIGSNVKKIGNKAFYKATALKKVTVPAKTTTIGSSAFYGCKKLTAATIGKNVKTIGNSAFAKCTALKAVTVPANVNKIGSKAFYGDKKLKNITIKSKKLTASKVGNKAFKGVYSKAKVNVPNKKVKAYKKFFYKKGLSKKAKIF